MYLLRILLIILVVYVVLLVLRPGMYSIYPLMVLVPLIAYVQFRPDIVRSSSSSSNTHDFISEIDYKIGDFLSIFFPGPKGKSESAGRRRR